jgi:hypothetical protein
MVFPQPIAFGQFISPQPPPLCIAYQPSELFQMLDMLMSMVDRLAGPGVRSLDAHLKDARRALERHDLARLERALDRFIDQVTRLSTGRKLAIDRRTADTLIALARDLLNAARGSARPADRSPSRAAPR